MIPLYILGLLQRYGPMHGYQIKTLIAEQLADFTDIKLPTIYYHLEKMAGAGLLSSICEKPGNRPAKTTYQITETGRTQFTSMLTDMLTFEYSPTFPSDSVFYFSEHLEIAEITVHLQEYIHRLDASLTKIQEHRKETLQFVPDDMRVFVNIIFGHHLNHYQAERDWALASLDELQKKESAR